MILTDQLAHIRNTFEKDLYRNVFVIMRYAPKAPFVEIEKTIKETLQRYGLKAVLAKDVAFHQQLWNHVRFCMEFSRYAIVVFESILNPDFNPNVTLELGYMLAKGRPCLILKEKAMPKLHTDIIGHLYVPFNAHKVKETVRTAVENWLEGLGHTSIKPAETITAATAIEAYKERTRRIVSALSEIASDLTIRSDDRIIRQAASLSSLAISDKERHEGDDGEYHDLLLRERSWFRSLLEDGTMIRIIISPDTQVARVNSRLVTREYAEENILPRYEQLIRTIKKNLGRNNLQIVYVPRLRHDNILILNKGRILIGRKRMREMGFPHTTLIYDPAVITDEIDEFDTIFNESAGVILGEQHPQPKEYGSEKLKLNVVERLKESQREIKHLLSRLSSRKSS